jgi:hypothetical protein
MRNSPPLRRSLAWTLFLLCVLATASLTAAAETRLLGAPTADATLLLGCLDTNRTAAMVDACERGQTSQAYVDTLRNVQTPCPYVGPTAGDACAALLVNTGMLAQARADVHATWEADADAVCKQGAQEMCDNVSAFRARQQSTLELRPPWCEGIAAPDPRCTPSERYDG